VVDNHHFDGAPRRCHLEPQLIFNRTHTRRSEHRAKFLMTGSRSQRIMKCRESFRYARSEPFVSYFEGVYSIVRIVDVLRANRKLHALLDTFRIADNPGGTVQAIKS